MIDATARRYAALAVPRYTSYPTAADFTETVSSDLYGAWLRRLSKAEPVSLYIHVPYCRELCYYCGCYTKVAQRDQVIENYAQSLIDEIKLAGSFLPDRPKVVRLHWGGGTPSILGGNLIRHVVEVLQKYFDFSPEMEHAIELDPRHVNAELVQVLAEVGVNRASLGIQDMDIQVQQAIGRVQSLSQVETTVALLRDVGIEDLNFDLIYGLPLQTCETLANTCAQVIKLQPTRVACYGYAHLPQRRANQRLIASETLPDADMRFAQAQTVSEVFSAAGYLPVGLDHYALPDDALGVAARSGQLHRNFQGYTDDACPTLIGFGTSSISQFREGYLQNIADIGQYKSAIGQGCPAISRGYVFNDRDRMRAQIIAQLMCNFEVQLQDFAPVDSFSDELALLRSLTADALVSVQDGHIRMTQKGRPLVRLVAAVFDEFRRDCAQGFSAAV